jgi:hypothetical protein
MQKEKKQVKKIKYLKPVLTKHRKLRDITAGVVASRLPPP